MAKVWIDQNECISCQVCVSLHPDIFEIGKDGKAHLKKGKEDLRGEELEKAKESAKACPAGAIHIEE